jgi:serine protease AprX
MTMTVGASVPTGSYPITVTGTGGGVTRTTTITLMVVVAPSFIISVSPGVVVIPPGGSVDSTITTAAVGAFDSAITLSATGQPSGLAVSFHPNPIPAPGSGSSTMTMKMGPLLKAGCYPITVKGTGASLTRTTILQMWVGAPTGKNCLQED